MELLFWLIPVCQLISAEPGSLYSFTEFKGPVVGHYAIKGAALPYVRKWGEWEVKVRGQISGTVYTFRTEMRERPFYLTDDQQFLVTNYSNCETKMEPR
jgi:hypothetical protein